MVPEGLPLRSRSAHEKRRSMAEPSPLGKAIAERGGYALMPEWETRPANQYLPKRK